MRSVFLPARPIGVSKRTCLCCALWIESYNQIFGSRWLTSESHGKSYANWALPRVACSYAVGEDGRSSIDIAVLEAVSARLADALAWLLPGQRRIPDQYVSSDESSSNKQGASEFEARVDMIIERARRQVDRSSLNISAVCGLKTRLDTTRPKNGSLESNACLDSSARRSNMR